MISNRVLRNHRVPAFFKTAAAIELDKLRYQLPPSLMLTALRRSVSEQAFIARVRTIMLDAYPG